MNAHKATPTYIKSRQIQIQAKTNQYQPTVFIGHRYKLQSNLDQPPKNRPKPQPNTVEISSAFVSTVTENSYLLFLRDVKKLLADKRGYSVNVGRNVARKSELMGVLFARRNQNKYAVSRQYSRIIALP